MENLHYFGIGSSFRTIEVTARAAKLRLMRDLGIPTIRKEAELIQRAQRESLHRPFGNWHSKSYAQLLCDNWDFAYKSGVKINLDVTLKHFQQEARIALAKKLVPYDMEERIRSKVSRWNFQGPPRLVASRLVRNFEMMQKAAPPAVISTYLRALWNGIPTSRRMRTCKDFKITG